MHGVGGHHGWQWLFVVQGVPACVLGIVAYFHLKDKPEQAGWLTPSEKAALRNHIDSDAHTVEVAAHGSFLALLRDPKVFTMSLVYFMCLGANYALVFFTPTLIKSWGIADVFTVGLLSSVGPLFGVIGMVLIGRSSDRYLERRRHFFGCVMLAATGLLLAVFSQGSLGWALLGVCIMTIGQAASSPIFFAAISEYLPRKSAAAGIALISSLGNLGPSVTPLCTTWITGATGSFIHSAYLVAALWVASGLILMRAIRPASVMAAQRLAAA
jgi:sugar phosphate permease